jgi:lysophospholipid acyltransferase (LPLAT)-like uncharacterized protein
VIKRFRNLLVEWLGTLLIRLVGPTLRARVRDDAGFSTKTASASPVIFAFWHNQMFVMPYVYRRFLRPRPAVCLVSISQDGEMIARVLAHFGLGTARGSSSRRSREACLTLLSHLKEGKDVGITPDGPRGPRHQAHAGVVGLASLSGCPVIPLTCDFGWKIELPTWDRFIIPLPFSTWRLHFGKPISVAESLDDDALEEVRKALEQRLCELPEGS